ncbi:MAG: aminotransferase class IV [Bacteriovorax sp.]|nr:aminotransferase class IV [Bacteriovorax sp.]
MDKFLININGELFNEEKAKISVFDRGFLYGDSVYEATRTFNRIPFRIQHHLDRLFFSAQKIELELTYSRKEILELILQTIKASPHNDIFLRIILTRGTNIDLGLDPELSSKNNLIIITKAITPNPDWWLTKGLSMIFHNKKSSERGPLPKTGKYLENILAYKDATEKGAFDSIMVNTAGHVTEGTTSNIWMIKDNIIYTPSLQDGVLDGLTRKTLIQMADRNNLMLQEISLTQEDFLGADECFITSTTRNLVPVTIIEGRPVGNGLPGKKTLELLKMYLEFVSLQ